MYALILCAPAAAAAQRTLSLDDTLAIARRQNRDLSAARERLQQANAQVGLALAALLPTAAAQGKYTHNYKEVTLDLAQQAQGLFGLADVIKATSGNPVQNGAINAYEQRVAASLPADPIIIQKAEQLDFSASLTLPLVVPSAYPALSAAKKSALAAQAGFGASEAQLLFAVAQSFYAAAGTDELVGARRHGVEVADRTFKDARSRFDAGVVNRVHVMRAQLALERAEQARAEAEDAHAQAYRALATLLALREPFKVAPSETPPAVDAPADLVGQALGARPELLQLERSLDAARAQTRAAAWRWAPSLSAFGLVRAFNYRGFSGDFYAWAVGAQLDWLLFDGGVRDAQRKQSASFARESELRLSIARDQIADEVVNAQKTLATRRRAMTTAKNAVELSRETLNLVRAQNEAGTATQLDLLQAQDALVSAEVGLAQSRFELALADLALERTVGTFPSRNAQ